MLTVKNLSASYGQAIALQNINLSVDAGKIVTIIGPNGAGKTTLVNTIAGILRPTQGEIVLAGQTLTDLPPHELCNQGIAIVPEGRRLFTKMTVLDNLKLGSYPKHARNKAKQRLAWVYDLFPILANRKTQQAGTLSGGEQQMLAIGRALLACPKLLLLDEPSLGLAPIIVGQIFNIITRINKETDVSILLVEQNVNQALTVAHKGYILSQGHIIKQGNSKVLAADNSIQAAYLGITIDNG